MKWGLAVEAEGSRGCLSWSTTNTKYDNRVK